MNRLSHLVGLIVFCLTFTCMHVNAQSTITVGTGTAFSETFPLNGYYNYSWSNSIYLANQIGKSGSLTSIGFYVDNASTNIVMNNQKIYVRHTGASSYTSSTYQGTEGFTLVYDGSITLNGLGWKTITFNTPFNFNGTENLEFLFENKDGSYVTTFPYYRYTSTGSGAANVRTKRDYQDATFPSTCYTCGTVNAVPNMQFTITPCTFNSGIATPTLASVVPGNTATVTLSDQAVGSSIQWQSSDDNLLFTTISGATDPSYSETIYANRYYRAILTNTGCSKVSTTATITADLTTMITKSIGSGTAVTEKYPFNEYYNNSWSNMIYKASDIQGSGKLSRVAFNVSNSPVNVTMPNQKIYVKTVSPTTVAYTTSNYPTTAGFTLVYEGPITFNGPGWKEIVFNKGEFYYNGTDNLEFLFESRNGAYTNDYPTFYTSIGGQTDYSLRRDYKDYDFPTTCTSCGKFQNTLNIRLGFFPCTSVAGSASATSAGICTGANTTLNLTGQTAGSTIQWKTSTNNIDFTNITGATSASYITPNLTTTTYYKAVVISGVCTTTSNTVTVGVSSTTAGTITSSKNNICSSNTVDLSIAGQTAGSTIQWQSSTDGTTFTNVLGNGTSIIANGDFEAGNTGFTSNYTYTTTLGNGLYPEATYAIGSDPHAFHPNFPTFADHTGGVGTNFMIVNGAIGSGSKVWCESMSVVPGQTYKFSCWATTVIANNASELAVLNFDINGINVGSSFSPTITQGAWTQYNTYWTCPAGVTTANFCIENDDLAAGGNDFGLDDISFVPIGTGAPVTATSFTTDPISANSSYRAVVTNSNCTVNSNIQTINVTSVTAGSAAASVSTVVINGSSTVSLSGQTAGSTIQWQSSNDNVTFTNITGTEATTSSYTALNLFETLYFKAIVTNTSCTATSNTITVTVDASSLTTSAIGTGTVSFDKYPFNGYYDYSWSSMLYKASEINATGKLARVSFYVDNAPVNETMNNQKIYVRHATTSEFIDGVYPTPSGFTLVYDGSITYNGTGWKEIAFNKGQFEYNGVDDLEFLFENRDGSWSQTYPIFRGQSGMDQNRVKRDYSDGTFPATCINCGKYNNILNIKMRFIPCSINGGTVNATVTNVKPLENVQLTLAGQENAGTIQWEQSTDNITFTVVPNQTGTTLTIPMTVSNLYVRTVTKVGCSKYSNVVTITPDNCFQATPQIGNGSLESYKFPFNVWYNYSWSNVIYTKEEVGPAGKIASMSFNVTNSPVNYVTNNQKIYVRKTDARQFEDATYSGTTGFTNVFEGTITYNGQGWKEIVFTTPFEYDGTSNLEFLFENRDGSYGNDYPKFAYTDGQLLNRSKRDFADNAFPATCVTCLQGMNVPNTRFKFLAPSNLAGTVSATKTEMCDGQTSVLNIAGQVAGSTIQWQSSSDNVVFVNVDGATTSSYTTSEITATTYYRAVVSMGSCTLNSSVITVQVSSVNAGVITSTNTEFCAGTPAIVTFTLANQTPQSSIQWKSSIDNVSFTNINNEFSTVYTTPNLSTTTYYKAVVSKNGCEIETNTIAVHILNSSSSSILYDEITETGSIYVSIACLGNKVAPFNYQISESPIKDLTDSYYELRDTTWTPDDSLQFFMGTVYETNYTFSDLTMGLYYVSVFDSRGIRIMNEQIQFGSPLQISESQGMSIVNGSIESSTINAKGTLDVFMNDATTGAVVFQLTDNIKSQYLGLLTSTEPLIDKTSVAYGFTVLNGFVYPIESGVQSQTAFAVTLSSELRLFQEKGVLRYLVDGMLVKSITLPETFTLKIGLGLSEIGIRVKAIPVRLTKSKFYFSFSNIHKFDCNDGKGGFTFNAQNTLNVSAPYTWKVYKDGVLLETSAVPRYTAVTTYNVLTTGAGYYTITGQTTYGSGYSFSNKILIGY